MREMAGRQTYYAWGFGGQFIVLVPSLDLGRRVDLGRNRERRSARRIAGRVDDIIEHLIIAPLSN